MSKGAKFLIKYRLIANGIALGIGVGIYLLLTLLFNIGDLANVWPAILSGSIGVATVVGLVMLFVLPRRSFNLAVQFGIDRNTLWWTDILTPVCWSLLITILGLLFQQFATNNLGHNQGSFWIGMAIILALFFTTQALADIVALVHGFWKVVVIVGLPSLLMSILIWILTCIAQWMSKTNWTLSQHQINQIEHLLTSPGIWTVVLIVYIAIMILLTWVFTKMIRLQRD